VIDEEPKTPLGEIPHEKFFEALSEGNKERGSGEGYTTGVLFMDNLENVRLYRKNSNLSPQGKANIGCRL
jgi:hypothetical protein